MQVMKILVVCLLSLHLGGCLGLVAEALPPGMKPTYYSRRMTVSGTGFGVEPAKFMAVTIDQFSPDDIRYCEHTFSSSETVALGFSKDQYHGRRAANVGDPRNRIYIRKSQKTCDDLRKLLRDRAREYERVRRGY